VALERQSIEKKDFPIGRRGYDPEAVDAHLRSLADEVDELKLSARRRTETLASAAGDQVRAIVDAAEQSAAAIQRQAEEEAQEIRAEATSEAQSTREQATSQAREYVGKVSESTSVMLQRLDAMESELGAMIDALRTGANRLGADLQLLEGNLADVKEAVVPRPPFEPEAGQTLAEQAPSVADATPPAADAAEPAQETDLFEEQAASEGDGYGEAITADVGAAHGEPAAAYEPIAADQPMPSEESEPVAVASSPSASDDTEGARLIALNMALNGTPRDETDRYLEANFTLADRDRLLDEVYASVEG